MSRNNKNATRYAKARELSKARQAGNKGATKTQPVHGKKHTYRTNPEIAKRMDEQAKALRERDEANAVKWGKAAEENE